MRRGFLCRVLFRVAVALAVVGAAVGVAPASVGAQSEGVGYFSDDDGSVHEPALEALAARGVLTGIECGERMICPREPLKRWEMAVWLVRVLDGTDQLRVDAARFVDVDAALWWAPFVERLYSLQVTVGCATEPARFCPEGNVTRAQMAAFLQRAFNLAPATSAGFADVSGSFHASSIDALAAAGITAGCGRDPLRFCPDSPVSRAEMATFLARSLGVVDVPASMRFSAVSTGANHSCGLRGDGSIHCWGSNPFGQADSPAGQFRALSAGANHSCGLRGDGSIHCWGSNALGQANAPPGRFAALAAGWGHTCGLRIDRSVECWGVNWNGRADPPGGQFSAVAAGDASSCGLRTDGSISCWGRPQGGEVPAGRFDAIAVGSEHSCGVRGDGSIDCWGANWIGQAASPDGRFSAVAVGGSHSCGLRTNGAIACWGSNWLGQADPPPGQFMAIAAGDSYSCGLAAGGTVVCWGGDSITRTGAPSERLNAVDAGLYNLCGLREDGSIACTGGNSHGQSNAPDGPFSAVSAGELASCGVRADASVTCWGTDVHGETFAPQGRFRAVAVGTLHSCGLRTDGSVVCWGDNTVGQLAVPAGRFDAVSVAVGGWHSCGLRTGGSVACWGSNSSGQADAPSGRFSAVVAGRRHSCGLRTSGTITCWGSQSEAPEGRFQSLAAGTEHSCAVRPDGAVACWGDNSSGQADAPEGRFVAVTADAGYSCGLRADSTVACWGLAMVATPPRGVLADAVSGSSNPRMCRPPGSRGATTAGFPLPPSAVPSIGRLRVGVLFVDFSDAEAPFSTRHEAQRNLPFIERYLEASSYGGLDIEFVPLHRWLRVEHGYGHYTHGSSLGDHSLETAVAREAASLADPNFDFSGIDALMVVHPSSHFGGGSTAQEYVRTQEGYTQTLLINTFRVQGPSDGREWGDIAAHEILHNLGLLDLYPYDASRHRTPPSGSRGAWILTEFGPMRLRAYVSADDRLGTGGYREALEMLAWSRWQLGWLDYEQVRCLTDRKATVELDPIADPGDGIAMAAVPLSDSEVIVIESRRRTGFDSGAVLLAEGVLVYTVNASISSGLLPIKLAGDPGNSHFDDYPLLAVGESVTVRGYTITVVADDGHTHTVRITRTADG